MKSKTIVIIVVLALLIGGGLLYFLKFNQSEQSLKQDKKEQPTSEKVEQGLGAEVYGQAQNPVNGQIPGANPFKFKEEYKNPFE